MPARRVCRPSSGVHVRLSQVSCTTAQLSYCSAQLLCHADAASLACSVGGLSAWCCITDTCIRFTPNAGLATSRRHNPLSPRYAQGEPPHTGFGGLVPSLSLLREATKRKHLVACLLTAFSFPCRACKENTPVFCIQSFKHDVGGRSEPDQLPHGVGRGWSHGCPFGQVRHAGLSPRFIIQVHRPGPWSGFMARVQHPSLRSVSPGTERLHNEAR